MSENPRLTARVADDDTPGQTGMLFSSADGRVGSDSCMLRVVGYNPIVSKTSPVQANRFTTRKGVLNLGGSSLRHGGAR